MTHPGRTESKSRIEDMIDKLDKINSEEEAPKAADFDDEMDHVLGKSEAKEEPVQETQETKAPETEPVKAESKPAPKRNGKKEAKATKNGKGAKAAKSEKDNGKGKNVKDKKTTKRAEKPEGETKRRRARDPGTVELQKGILTVVKRAAGKPIAVSKLIEKLEGKGDVARERQIRNALRGPQKDGLIEFTTVEGKKGFVKYIGS